jgi:hypothetical protein
MGHVMPTIGSSATLVTSKNAKPFLLDRAIVRLDAPGHASTP